MYLNYHSNTLSIRETVYTILGRITYTYNEGGYWDEYLLESKKGDPDHYWLEYDNGLLKLFRPYPLVRNIETPDLNSLEVGETKYLFGRDTLITNKIEAHVSDYFGIFPYSLSKGDSIKIIEGIANGLLVGIELEGNELELSFGEIIPFSSVKR